MKYKTVHLKDINHIISKSTVVKKKRERSVFYYDGKFYKLWVSNWSQGDITKAGFDKEFYDKSNTESFVSLIHDDTGQRGYIMNEGKSLCKNNNHRDWSTVVENTTRQHRKEFFLSLLEKSIASKGLYLDFASSNVILYKGKLNLIDLESYGSFSFVFDGKTQWFEKFDLNAKWKPLETARRDLNLFYHDYLTQCLNIKCKKQINNVESLMGVIELIVNDK